MAIRAAAPKGIGGAAAVVSGNAAFQAVLVHASLDRDVMWLLLASCAPICRPNNYSLANDLQVPDTYGFDASMCSLHSAEALLAFPIMLTVREAGHLKLRITTDVCWGERV
jgi:hypothetical protein